MRTSLVAVVLTACLSVGVATADDAAPQCAVDCASSIRNENGSLDLKAICADKLRTNSLFQCLIGSCPQDTYGPAVSHVVLACSNLGLGVGPLFPVEVQHIDLEKPSYRPTPSLPAAYSKPSDDTSPENTEHLSLSFDISLDLKCNSGSDGLVTVSLPPPASSPSSTPSPPLAPSPSPAPTPPSPPTPDPGNGNGEGEGDGSNGSDNGNEKSTVSTSPAEQTPTTPEPADTSATSSCPPDSTPSSVQAPGDEHTGDGAPPHSTELGEHGDPAATSTPSPTPPSGGDPNTPSADPNATFSCPSDSAPSNVQTPGDDHAPGDENAPGDEHAPPQSTELGEHGDPAATSIPSPTPPNGGDPNSPSADPNAASSCPPDSAPSSVQAPGDDHVPGDDHAPGDEHAPPQSTELGEHGNPAPSPVPPNGDDPSSPSSETPCSTASVAAGVSGPEDAEDHSQPLPSPSPTQEASDQPNDGDKPDVSATSDVDGMPAPAPVPASPTPAPTSSPCSTADGADVSADPIPGPQEPQHTEPTPAAQESSPPRSSSPAPTSLMEPEPLSTVHPKPLPLPSPSPPSYQTDDDSDGDSGNAPPEYASSGGNGQSPGGENSGSEASLPESNTEPPPQDNHGTEVDNPSSYGQESQVAPVPVPVPASQTNGLAVQDADGKPTGKPTGRTTEPSEVTLWPTATSNHTSCTTGPAKEGGSLTTSCKTDGKRTTVHPPRSMLPMRFDMRKDALFIGDNQQNEPLGSVMIKIIRPGDQSAETIFTALWENNPPVVTMSRKPTEGLESKESGHASATQLSAGSKPIAESTTHAGHRHVGSSTSMAHTGLTTSRPKPDHSSTQPNSTATGPSPPRIALVSSDSKLAPYLYVMTLLVVLTS